jgi:hypothetical protein
MGNEMKEGTHVYSRVLLTGRDFAEEENRRRNLYAGARGVVSAVVGERRLVRIESSSTKPVEVLFYPDELMAFEPAKP